MEVNNLAKLVEVAEACKDKYLRVELDYNQASICAFVNSLGEPFEALSNTI